MFTKIHYVKILGAVGVAGAIAAGGSAFTGAGLTNSAGTTQFLGGNVDQSVTGASLTGVVYGFSDAAGAHRNVNLLTLTFGADGLGKTVGVTPTAGTWAGGTATHFACDAVHDVTGTPTSVCSPKDVGGDPAAGYLPDVTNLNIAVS